MATKVARTRVKREKGWLYYLDKRGNVSRARMARGGGKGGRRRKSGKQYKGYRINGKSPFSPPISRR